MAKKGRSFGKRTGHETYLLSPLLRFSSALIFSVLVSVSGVSGRTGHYSTGLILCIRGRANCPVVPQKVSGIAPSDSARIKMTRTEIALAGGRRQRETASQWRTT